MSTKDAAAEKAKAETPTATESPAISLDEFCRRLSESERHPEMIAAFHYRCTEKGDVRMTEEAYRARYVDFKTAKI